MKKTNLITFLFLLITSVAFAQNPQAFTYQAIAKDATGQVLANQAIGIQISIRQTTTTGTIVYQETHTATTTNSGFFLLFIGTGTVQQGTFNTIDWGIGLYFMETAMDATGGTSYVSIGTSPILTVPKANYAYDGPDADATNELITTAQLTGTNLEITDAGGTKTVDLSSLTTGSSTTSLLQDADNDTKIQVEESADEDVIRFDLEGSERLVVKKNAAGVAMIELNNNNNNIFIGKDAGLNTTPISTYQGKNNIFIGKLAGSSNTVGQYNTFIGNAAGNSNTTGSNNIFTGHLAGSSNTTGSNNIFTGKSAGYSNTTGGSNIFIGIQTGMINTTGNGNVFTGHETGIFNVTGSGNVFTGHKAGHLNSSGGNNVFTGKSAGHFNTTGYSNVFTGSESGYSNTTGRDNTFIGISAGYSNTTGKNNTFIGNSTGYTNIAGDNNVFLGNRAGYSETGSNKLYIENSNSSSPLIYGEFDNDIVKINGSLDVGLNNPSTSYMVKFEVFGAASIGGSDLILGKHDGRIQGNNGNNRALVHDINDILTINYAGDFEGGTRIDGDLNVTGIITAPGFTSSSDHRLKEEFNHIKNPLAKLSQLNGYTYYWKDKTNDATLQVGVVAQEVEAVLPEIVHTDSKGIKSVDYSKLTALLIEVNKVQETKIEKQAAKIERLEVRLAQVEKVNQTLKTQATETAKLSAQLKTLQQQINQLLPLKTTASK